MENTLFHVSVYCLFAGKVLLVRDVPTDEWAPLTVPLLQEELPLEAADRCVFEHTRTRATFSRIKRLPPSQPMGFFAYEEYFVRGTPLLCFCFVADLHTEVVPQGGWQEACWLDPLAAQVDKTLTPRLRELLWAISLAKFT